MAKAKFIPTPTRIEERDGTRIRAFLAHVKPLRGCYFSDAQDEGRSLIERLAVACDLEIEHHWTLPQIADVVSFLNMIEPVKGACFCGDKDVDGVSLTCGHQAVLNMIEDELRRIAAEAKKRKTSKLSTDIHDAARQLGLEPAKKPKRAVAHG